MTAIRLSHNVIIMNEGSEENLSAVPNENMFCNGGVSMNMKIV